MDAPTAHAPTSIEIFVAKQFAGLELAAITHTLDCANNIAKKPLFRWRFVAQVPGLVTGDHGVMVRAEPAIDNYALSDMIIVIGGRGVKEADWIKRVRLMRRKQRPILLLSDAATTFIRHSRDPSATLTTHWQDLALLDETGYHPNLTRRLAEKSNGIITGAGGGATSEIVISLIASRMTPAQILELGNQLLLKSVRAVDEDQPTIATHARQGIDPRVAQAISAMEDNIADPLSIPALGALMGISDRQLERLFDGAFEMTPKRYYKRLRVQQARLMIDETRMPLVEVAIATGFRSSDSLAKALKEEYGKTPFQLRKERPEKLIKF